MTESPFTHKGERANDQLGLIHTNVCGPFSTSAIGGYLYFITFTDDFNRYGFVYLMRHKSESFEKFKEFKSEVQNQLGKNIKALKDMCLRIFSTVHALMSHMYLRIFLIVVQ